MKTGNNLKAEWDRFITDGDNDAYYDLYAHYHKYFFYIGIKKGALDTKIGDCIHDLFLFIFENREKLGAIKNHHNYLITSFLHALFKKERFSAEESEELDTVSDYQSIPGADHSLMIKDTTVHVRQLLQSYINALSVSQARMVYEKFYLGLSYEEIALANDITVRTAYNTIFTAMNRLRVHIGEHQMASLISAITAMSLVFWVFCR